jgi:hypothetical protein
MASMLGYTNRVDAGTLTAGDTTANLPIINLTNIRLRKVWRSGTSISTWFGVDFGAAYSIRLLGVFGLNFFGASDTIRHRLSAVALGNSELLDVTLTGNVTEGFNQSVRVLAAAVSARYWRCDINAVSRTTNFDVGRAWASNVFAPAVGINLGHGEGWVDTSTVERSARSGGVFPDAGAVYRVRDFEFDSLTDAERVSALDLDRTVGRRGQVLFVPDDAGTPSTEAILGRLTDTTRVRQPTDASPARFSKSYEIEQDL